ncbi:MAG: class F sortase, partial [Terracoccus sp.]
PTPTAAAIRTATSAAPDAPPAASGPASQSAVVVNGPVDATRDAIPGPAVRAGGPAPTTPSGLRPERLSIPAIGVSSSLETLGIGTGGTVDVPKNPDLPGWLDRSPAPGQQGPAVIIGHLDSKTGPAVFLRLRELKVGDPVVVTRHDGTKVTFTVDGVQTFTKTHFPTEATYGPVPGPALRLITCGGTYDHANKSYESNVIVFAS